MGPCVPAPTADKSARNSQVNLLTHFSYLSECVHVKRVNLLLPDELTDNNLTLIGQPMRFNNLG